MTEKTGQNNQDSDADDRKHDPLSEDVDGDLGFAGDPTSPIIGKPARDATDQPEQGVGKPFIPTRPPGPEAESSAKATEDASAGDPNDPNKTWVPTADEQSQPSDLSGSSDDETDEDQFEKTWVPSDFPTDPESETSDSVDASDAEKPLKKTWVPADASHPSEPEHSADESADTTNNGIDAEKTWVPADTPDSAESDQATGDSTDIEDANIDVEKTWVPTDTPTHTGLDRPSQDSAESDEPPDPRQTQIPSSTPTLTGMDPSPDAAAKSEVAAVPFEKTWVAPPAVTPQNTTEDSGESEADPNKTVVPMATPTYDGSQQESDDANDLFTSTAVMEGASVTPEDPPSDHFSGTVVIPERIEDQVDPSDSASHATVVAEMPVTPENTQVFSKTMGMRGLTEEEYLAWRAELSEKIGSDTAVLIDEVADEASLSTFGKRTQIWSKQSTEGLDASLTIRSRPVAGDNLFEVGPIEEKPDYQIVEKLAEGGMGAVYIATQTSLDRELAIKTLKPLRAHEKKSYAAQGRLEHIESQRREMFLSEALVTANLVHPHIIPIHDLCQTNEGSPFYSMKRVNGTPWNESIQDMPLEENLEVLHKVCDAVAYAHHNGVVNRDLKPENIMLGEFGEVLVLDWGLAVPATLSDKRRFASPSASFGAGTPAYMSPELWTGPPVAIGTWSDIYLLGAILFEVITGDSPHIFPEPESEAGNSGLWMIIDSVVRRNEIRPTNEKGELMDIAMKAMSTDPRERHKTVLEFQNAIKSFQKHEESRHLTIRANETLGRAQEPATKRGYQDFQTAAALFEEAHTAWPENETARTGLRKTRLAYAGLAYTKGDYDLGLQIAAQEQGAEFQELSTRMSKARRLRNGLKSATMAAVGIIAVVGAISFYQAIKIAQQKNEIVDLYGDVESLEGQKSEAEALKQKAVAERGLAEKAKADAEQERLVAMMEKIAAEDARQTAETATTTAKMAQEQAEKDRRKAEQLAVVAKQEKADADKLKDMALKQQAIAERAAAEAEEQKLVAKRQTAEAQRELVNVEKQKIRAGVELHNAEIANLIRNADYSSALRGVEELLSALENDPDLAKLPAEEREQRVIELKARQRQLLKRSRTTQAPIQTQVIGPSGRTVVWGDSEGNLTAWNLESAVGEFPEKPQATLAIHAAVSCVKITDDERLVVASAGNTLHLWTLADNTHQTLTGHTAPITSVKLAESFLLVADAGGTIRAWDRESLQERWSIRSSAAIRDIVLMPKSGIFLYAGSRGGESADILAYQLPPESAPTSRPQRLGQLRLPRNRNYPPKRIAVSPDEQLLLISNSRNGEIMMLPRIAADDVESLDRFPFVHAADLAAGTETHWILGHHQRPVNDIVFSADGRRMATASDDRSIGVWELLASGHMELRERLEGHGAKVNAAGFLDAGGHKVLSASADRFCRFWNVDHYSDDRREIEAEFDLPALGSETTHLRSESDTVVQQAVSIRSSLQTVNRISCCAQGDADRPPLLRSPSGARWIHTAFRDRRSQSDEAVPARTNSDYMVINANNEMQRGALKTILLSADGRRLVTGATDGTAVIWDTATGKPVTGVSTRSQFESETGSFDEGHDFNVARLQFLPPGGDVLMTTGFDGNLCLWNADLKNSGAGAQEVRVPGLGLVNAIATSSDGVLLATSVASNESEKRGATKIWKTQLLLQETQPAPEAVLQQYHLAEVSAIAFNTDGTRIATGARDGRVAIWSTSSGQFLAGGQMHAKNTIISHLEWISDESVLSAGFDGKLQVLQLDASQERLTVQTLFTHDKTPIERIAIGPECRQFVSISVRTDRATRSTSYEMHLWAMDALEPIRRIRPAIVKQKKPERIAAIDWSDLGDRMAVVVDGKLQVFNTANWRVQKVLEAPGLGISDAIFAPQGTAGGRDVIATFDGTAAHLWDLNNKSHLADFRPLFAVQSTALSNNKNPILLTGDRAIRVFQAAEDSDDFGQTLFKISDPHRGIVNTLSFPAQADSTQFVSGGADGSAALWNWNAKDHKARLSHWLCREGSGIEQAAWSPDGKQILLTARDGQFLIFQAKAPDVPVVKWQLKTAGNVRLKTGAYSTDGRFVAVAGQFVDSGASVAWVYDLSDVDTPALHCTITGHEAGGIRCLSFLPDSPYLITGGTDGAAIIWNWQPHRADEAPVVAYEAYQFLMDGEPLAHHAPINALTVSRTGDIATASEDGTAVVWHNPFRP